MKNAGRPHYGNWVPVSMIFILLTLLCICCVLSVLVDSGILRGIFIAGSVVFGSPFVYMIYAYWLFGKNGGALQKQLCNALLGRLDWDGRGNALDIGTGNGRAAIYLAKKYPAGYCVGIDLWGKPWTYSRDLCDKNAQIEGVASRVSFQNASAVNLPFEDSEFDVVISNFVFHSVRVINKTALIKEALRVVKKGGLFAFQDLFNKQFYGDMDVFNSELQTWGLKEFKLVASSDFVFIPVALRVEHMVGNAKILYGIK